VLFRGQATDEQLQAIWSLCSEVSHEPGPRDASRRLSEGLTAILGAPTPVFSREVPPWKLLEGPRVTPEVARAARDLEDFSPAATTSFKVLRSRDGTLWATERCGRRSR
jgi:hypothetical protein